MNKIKTLVIAGGGTAGWMTAAAFSKLFPNRFEKIVLVESEQIGTVGVGEATIPHIRYFNARLGIKENEFIKATNATYKLGIDFKNWGAIGDSYIHPFGEFGTAIEEIPFHNSWLKAYRSGASKSIFDYSLPVACCLAEKFRYPSENRSSIDSTYSYAFHIDAIKYSGYLRELCENHGVTRIEGKITKVETNNDSGNISRLILESGHKINGDFFIDCTGFQSILLSKTLGIGFENWAHWLQCNTAIAAPSAQSAPPKPYTVASAHDCGWQWCIPLQNRMGNGFVFNRDHLSEDEACEKLKTSIKEELLAEPKTIKFTAGRFKKTWEKNCVAIGLSSGFLEPLESTSIYLIQSAIMKLADMFPADNESSECLRDEFNRQMKNDYERIRDFIILHYHVTSREDSEFWQHCKNMNVPQSLREKITTFANTSYVDHYTNGLFLTPSWLAVYFGQGLFPKEIHLKSHDISIEKINKSLKSIQDEIQKTVKTMPTHSKSLSENVTEEQWPQSALSLYGVFS